MYVDICELPAVDERIGSADAVVIVDALRASATLAMLLECGVTSVRPVTDRDEIPDEESYLTVGEQNGKRLDGFDLDNSPRTVRRRTDTIEGQQATLLTTNGTQCVAAVDHADTVLMGSVINKSALVTFCENEITASRLWLVPARRHGSFAQEDLYAVLQIRDAFADKHLPEEVPDRERQLRRADAETVFRESETGQYLSELGKSEEVLFCSSTDQCTAVPLLDDGEFIDASGGGS